MSCVVKLLVLSLSSKGSLRTATCLNIYPTDLSSAIFEATLLHNSGSKVEMGATSCTGFGLYSQEECHPLRCKHRQSPARYRSIYQHFAISRAGSYTLADTSPLTEEPLKVSCPPRHVQIRITRTARPTYSHLAQLFTSY